MNTILFMIWKAVSKVNLFMSVKGIGPCLPQQFNLPCIKLSSFCLHRPGNMARQ